MEIGFWIIPVIISLVLLFVIFKPSEQSGGMFSGLDTLFRFMWFIPMLLVWIVYLVVLVLVEF